MTITRTSERQAESCDLLIVNGYVISMDSERTIYPRGAIAISGRNIVAVGDEADVTARFRVTRTLDAQGGPVHPGFVDCHVHLMLTARGAFPDTLPFERSTFFYTQWRNALDPEEEYEACLLSCLELINNGVTCFMEAGTVLEPDVAAAAAEAVGIRGLLGDPYLWDVEGLSKEASIKRAPVNRARALKLLGGQLKRNTNPHTLVRGYVALNGDGTASDELMKAAKECADRAGVVLSQHQSFSLSDVQVDDKRFGEHAFVHFDRIGVLGKNCTFTHVNVLREDEVPRVVGSGMSITWCPSSCMVWGIGGTFRGRHAELHRGGTTIALGSDSANSCGRFDPSFQACLAVLTAKEKSRNRHMLTFEDGLEMATVAGARAAGLADMMGSLEPGKRADIVIRSVVLPEAQPGLDAVQSLIFSAGSKSVDTVLVDGQIVLKDGRSTRMDEDAAYCRARLSARRLLDKIGFHREYAWPSRGRA